MLRRAGLPPAGGELRAGTLGSFPTYLTGDGLVVKLFPEVFGGPENADAELAAYEALASSGLPVPEVVATGDLYPPDDPEGWRWPYLVVTESPGVPLRTIGPSLDAAARLRLAADVGRFLAVLHRSVPPASGSWERFLGRIGRRRLDAREHLERGGNLRAHLLAQIPSFVGRFPDDVLFAPHERPPVLVHGDLHADHLFVEPSTGRLVGVIDWGDSIDGDPRHDLAALHAGSFFGDRELLGACLDEYGRRFDPEELLAVMLLHDFDLFAEVPEDVRRASRSLEELAVGLWG